MKLLHEALLVVLREAVEAGITAQHPFLILDRHAAVFIEPGAEVPRRRGLRIDP